MYSNLQLITTKRGCTEGFGAKTTQYNGAQHNGTQHIKSQHNDTQHNKRWYHDTQLNETQHNDTQPKNCFNEYNYPRRMSLS